MSSSSSGRWIARHLSDPWVHKAVKESARSRAYFKLEGILQQQRGLLFKGARVVDLGAAPGGWSLAAQKRIGEKVRSSIFLYGIFAGDSLSHRQLSHDRALSFQWIYSLSNPLVVAWRWWATFGTWR
jgi:23S rRNA U2552 (ribose-2'-O)-methylase RlmE/FtsJ